MTKQTTGAGRPGWVAMAIAAALSVCLVVLPAAAAARDRNHDKIPDRWEKRYHLSLHKKQGKRDQDRDQLRNRGEFKAGMNPRDADSDDDGVLDGDEGAGVIESFNADTGLLQIHVFADGSTLSGTVTDDTEIECENDDVDEPDEPGDDEEGDEDECTVDDLVPGRVVREAELELGAGGLVFEEIELK